MKNRNRNTELRDRDFADCCVETVRRARFNNEQLSSAEAVARAMAMRPRAFYVSSGYAYNQVLRIRQMGGDRYSTMATEPSELMWLEIYGRVMAAMESGDHFCLFSAVVSVVDSRPTRFYLSRRRAIEIFNGVVRRDVTFTPRKSYSEQPWI